MLLAAALGWFGFTAAAMAQWPDSAAVDLPIRAAAGDQATPLVAVAPDGRTWITWFDNSDGSYALRAQLLDVDGTKLLGPDGLLISDHPQNTALFGYDIVCDADGNLAVIFSDERAGGDLDLYAYRIAQDGTFLWGPDGITITDDTNQERAPVITQAGDGDFVVAFFPDVPAGQDGGIFLQRLAPDGTLRYAPGGIRVFTEVNREAGTADVVPADGANVIVSWLRDVESFSSPRHIHARKFNAAGEGVWPTHTVVFDATAVPIAHVPRLIPDGAGGAVIAWHTGLPSNCFVQHLNADGTESFAHNGLAVASFAGPQRFDPAITFDAMTGDISVFWSERDASQGMRGIFGQRISPAGQRLWGEGGREIAPVDDTIESDIHAVGTSDGGAMVFFTSAPFATQLNDTGYAMRVDANGDPFWEQPVLLHTSTVSDKFRYSLSIGGCNEVSLVWSDGRDFATNGQDIYAKKVNGDASLGTLIVAQAGDLNCDCTTDVGDIAAFALALTDEAAYASAFPGCQISNADMNEDESLDGFDLRAFVGLLLEN